MKRSINFCFLLLLSMFIVIANGCDGGTSSSSSSSSGGSTDACIVQYSVDASVYPQGPRNSAMIYHDCLLPLGDNTPATTLVSGENGSLDDLTQLAWELAKARIIVLAVNASDNQTAEGYAIAHKTGIGILNALNSDSTGKFYQKIGSLGLMGYALGGAGALDAAAELGDQVQTCIGLAPNSGSASGSLTASTLILTGALDTVVTPSMALDTYNALSADIAKMYAAVQSFDHAAWTDAESMVDSATPLIAAWLKYYLADDQDSLTTIQNPGSSFQNIEQTNIPTGSSSGGGCNFGN